MSLVGNLADLGLGDIFQIISLSRKSGVLQLTTPADSGEIHLIFGQVIAASRRKLEETVGDTLLDMEVINPQQFQEMLFQLKNNPEDPQLKPPLLWEKYGIEQEQIEISMRKKVEELIYAMFEWDEGTFSFILSENTDEPPVEMNISGRVFVVQNGINPQYLAMEGSRLLDERRKADPFEKFMSQEMGQPSESRSVLSSPANPVDTWLETDSEISFAGININDSNTDDDKENAQVVETEQQQVPPQKQEIKEESTAVTSDGEVSSLSALEASDTQRSNAAIPILIIDDDENFLVQLQDGLKPFSSQITVYASVEEGLQGFESIIKDHKELMIIADLIIARSDRSGILGGMEIVEKVRSVSDSVPIILVTDYDNQDAYEQAKQFGIQGFVQKPRRAQMKKDEVTEEMKQFISLMTSDLKPLISGMGSDEVVASDNQKPQETPQPVKKELQDEEIQTNPQVQDKAEKHKKNFEDTFDLGRELRAEFAEDDDEYAPLLTEAPTSPELRALKSMLAELSDPANKETITLLVLRYASEVLPRAALFLATKREVIGLGGYSSQTDSADFVKKVRNIRIPAEDESIFNTIIRFKAPYRGILPNAVENQSLIEGLGGEKPTDVFAAPIISGNRVAAILYGDNIDQEQKLEETQGLEIFLLQAGLAMERTVLERKLKEASKS